MIIQNIFKIKFHPFFYILLFVSLITGNFLNYLIFFMIVFVHELGHIFGGILFSWKIEKVIILPFGGLTIFNNMINTSLFQQFIVTLLGPLFQLVFYYILKFIFPLSSFLSYYNFVLLFFNLLPIFPLDGSKFLYVFLCMFFPFKFSHLLLLFISFLVIFLVVLFVRCFDLIIFLILLFLFIKSIEEFRNHRMIFNRFLFERYAYDFKFKRVRCVRGACGMYLWCRHLFFLNNKYFTERDYLLKRFDKYDDL